MIKINNGSFFFFFADDLDRYFVSFRNASRDDRLDRLSRLRMLEAIELRAMGWKQNDEISKYYQNKFVELEVLYTFMYAIADNAKYWSKIDIFYPRSEHFRKRSRSGHECWFWCSAIIIVP